MYLIIGGDGKEYGPVTADQVKRWIAAGRADLATRAKLVGTETWRPLGEFEAFGGFNEEPAAPWDPVTEAAPVLAAPAGQAFNPVDCFARSWDLLKAHFWAALGVSALVLATEYGLSLLIALVPGPEPELTLPGLWTYYNAYLHSPRFFAAEVEGLLIRPPLFAGLFYYFLQLSRGEPTSLRLLAVGFARYFPLVVAMVLAYLLTCLGLFFLILPGIYLAVAYTFFYLLVVDRRLGPWAALETSRQTVTRHWWSTLVLIFVAGLIFFLGAALSVIVSLGVAFPLLSEVVGLGVALPLVAGAFAFAYDDLFGRPQRTGPQSAATDGEVGSPPA